MTAIMRITAGILVAALFGCAAAQSGCPNVTVQQQFDIPAYTGRWFEVARFPVVFERNGACVTATYTPQSDVTYPVNVVNRMFNERLQEYDSIEGGARPADDSGEGRLLVSFPVAPREADYWVLETDYTRFSVVFSCREVAGVTAQASWILTRTPQVDAATLAAIDAVVARNGLDRDAYELTRQDENCDYTEP